MTSQPDTTGEALEQLVMEPPAPETEAPDNDELSELVSQRDELTQLVNKLEALGFLASNAGDECQAEEQPEVEANTEEEVHAHVCSTCSVTVGYFEAVVLVRRCCSTLEEGH